jgi:Icc-related predicted phosphoesterase
VIIDCISDLHGHYPQLDGGDLLIVAGDLTGADIFDEWCYFRAWLYSQKYRKKIVVAGNHDNEMIGVDPSPWIFSTYNGKTGQQKSFAEYLCDSGTEFDGLKIWGSPWTRKFKVMNPRCMAFTVDTEEELKEKWALIPQDTDILVTHSPAFFYYDKTIKNKFVGSPSLRLQLRYLYHQRAGIKLHVCGHVHEAYGCDAGDAIVPNRVNASHVNERYEPVNKPIRVIL